MFDHRIVPCAFVALTLFISAPLASADEAPPDDAAVAEAWSQKGWPLLERFCVDCHNEIIREAEVDLTGLKTIAGLEQQGPLVLRVLNMVRFGAMPPEDMQTPSDVQRETLVEALDQTLYAVSCDLRPRPGKVTARRLNRAEYNHTIRDLFGLDLRPADAFPSDEVGGGFDNNSDVLSLSPMQIEKYLTAAEEVSQKVLFDPATLPEIDAERGGDRLVVEGDSRTGSFNGRFLAEGAYAWAEVEIPYSGQYRLRFRGGRSEETPEGEKDPEPATYAVYDQHGVLLASYQLGYFGGGGGSDGGSTTLHLDEGKHRFIIEPIWDERELKVGESRFARLEELTDQRIAKGRKLLGKPLEIERDFDRAEFPLMIRELSVHGPTRPNPDDLPPSQDEILRRMPERRGGRYVDVRQAAIECLQPLMRRAFRQPVTKAEVQPYAELVERAVKRDKSYHRGLQIAISAVLVSPRFLFRVETPPESWQPEGEAPHEVRLTPYQLASRLSYFLWSSTPDEALLKSAESGELLEPEVLRRHVRRMLQDERADALGSQFAAQWLGLRNLERHEPDTERYERFDPSLLPAMTRETQLLFLHAVRENLPVAELLTADYSFLNGPLAQYYGVDGVEGAQFRKVSLQQTPRRGVLSHASVLTVTSNPTRTSPVKRGKWILKNILGTPPPDPPAGVPELEETKTASEDATLREQLELHRADPACAACHRVMDQLGFGLEQFNAVGLFRDRDSGAAIDASGVLPGGREFEGAAELSRVLGQSERDAFARTLIERLLTFALGRELTPADRCTVEDIADRTAKDDYRFQDIVQEIVRSRPFQYYEWTGTTNDSESQGTNDD